MCTDRLIDKHMRTISAVSRPMHLDNNSEGKGSKATKARANDATTTVVAKSRPAKDFRSLAQQAGKAYHHRSPAHLHASICCVNGMVLRETGGGSETGASVAHQSRRVVTG